MELRLSEFQIDRVISAQCDMVRPLAEEKNLDLVVNVPADLPPLYQDQAKIQQILTNLLSNAIKFTPEGGEISIDVYRRGHNIAISVSDTGIGMSEAEIPVALEPFGRLAAGGKLDSTGTGLGLPLTKRLAELHGGTLEVDSALGFGTTVTVLFPERSMELATEKNHFV